MVKSIVSKRHEPLSLILCYADLYICYLYYADLYVCYLYYANLWIHVSEKGAKQLSNQLFQSATSHSYSIFIMLICIHIFIMLICAYASEKGAKQLWSQLFLRVRGSSIRFTHTLSLSASCTLYLYSVRFMHTLSLFSPLHTHSIFIQYASRTLYLYSVRFTHTLSLFSPWSFYVHGHIIKTARATLSMSRCIHA
jgi:hypothetical protein